MTGAIVRLNIAFVMFVGVFAGSRVLASTYEYPTSGVMLASFAAIALVFAAWAIRRTLRLDYQWRFRRIMDAMLAPAAALLTAFGLTLPLLALLNDMPVINALLLDYVETARIGRLYQPYFASVYEIRYLIAVLFFVIVLALALPQAVWRMPTWQARPLYVSVGFAAAGCLSWLLGLGMADLGYGYALGGSVAGAGFFSVAVVQMGIQFTQDSDSVLADAVRWMAVSKTRSFMPGAAIAVYLLLLRPVMYDTLALAPVVEWLAVLATVAGAVLRMRSRLQTEINVVHAGSEPEIEWSRHEQVLETRPDPRAAAAWNARQAWIESGDPDEIRAYLDGLLTREGATTYMIEDVVSPLYDRSVRRSRRNRSLALDESYRLANDVMARLTLY